MFAFTACNKDNNPIETSTTETTTTVKTTAEMSIKETTNTIITTAETSIDASETTNIDFKIYHENIHNQLNNLYLNKKITTESFIVYDFSTEGAEIVLYKDDNDRLLRMNCHLMGEMGQSEINFYIIGDSQIITQNWSIITIPI